jgi:hypothetical protein
MNETLYSRASSRRFDFDVEKDDRSGVCCRKINLVDVTPGLASMPNLKRCRMRSENLTLISLVPTLKFTEHRIYSISLIKDIKLRWKLSDRVAKLCGRLPGKAEDWVE